MAIGFPRRAFRLRGWVRERKHDRSMVDTRHGLQHLGREGATDRRNADDPGGLERPDRGQKIADRRLIMGASKLVLLEARSCPYQQTWRGDSPSGPNRLRC